MQHAGSLNNPILSSKICFSLQFPFFKSSINLLDLFVPLSHSALLKIIALWFLLQSSSPTDSFWTKSFASLRPKIPNSLFLMCPETSCCSKQSFIESEFFITASHSHKALIESAEIAEIYHYHPFSCICSLCNLISHFLISFHPDRKLTVQPLDSFYC